MTEEEYIKIQDTLEFYELAYCIATNDFYYSGPYTRKCIGNKIYSICATWPVHINEITLDELTVTPSLSEFTDEHAYFFASTLEINNESIKKFITKIKEYIDRKVMDEGVQKIIANYKNLENKTVNDIDKV